MLWKSPFLQYSVKCAMTQTLSTSSTKTVFQGNYNNNNTLQHVILTLLILFLSNQLLQLLSFLLHLSFSIFKFILEGQKHIYEWRTSLKTAPKIIAQKEHIHCYCQYLKISLYIL